MTLQTSSSISPSSPVIVHRSPWHSPVPYLFGGLAAMLSLIAFALLILACSYSKHAGGRHDSADGERDLEAGDGDGDLKSDDHRKEPPAVFEEKFLVIMAGEENPTFLATPASSRVSSFGSCSCRSNSSENSPASEVTVEDDDDDDEKQGSGGDQVRVRSMGNGETADQ